MPWNQTRLNLNKSYFNFARLTKLIVPIFRIDRHVNNYERIVGDLAVSRRSAMQL